jgi:Holliday junction resolvasome RuvABC endonuclease subunit
MKIMAIDPGKSGCALFMDEYSDQITYHKFKFNKNNFLIYEPLNSMILSLEPDVIYIEKVQGRAGLGATQTFNFGFTTGQLIMVCMLSKIALNQITPQSWQKIAHRGINSKITPKERSMLAFNNLMPHSPLGSKPDKDIVDAFLMAYSQLNRIQKYHFNEFQYDL